MHTPAPSFLFYPCQLLDQTAGFLVHDSLHIQIIPLDQIIRMLAVYIRHTDKIKFSCFITADDEHHHIAVFCTVLTAAIHQTNKFHIASLVLGQ